MLVKWFGKDDRFNIGVFTGRDLLVVDCDRKAEDGDKNLRALAGEHVADLDNTFTVETPSGGRHYYFRGELVKNSVGRLAPAVDIRSRGGLVVGPGSDRADGKVYKVVNKAPIAPAPQWLLEAIAAAYVKADKVTLAAPVELDTEAAIAQAQAFLADAPPAIEGQGGNDRTYRVAAALKDIGVSEFMAGALMLGEWNARCEPPWEEDELLGVVGNAYRYSENSPGSQSVELMFDEITDDMLAEAHGNPAANDNGAPARRTSRLQVRTVDECAGEAATSRPYIIKGALAKHDVACIFGQPGAGKSLLAPHLGYAIARGEPVFGRRTRAGPVLYVAVEDYHGMKQRVAALRAQHGTTPNLKVVGGFNSLRDKDDWSDLLALVVNENPSVIVIDTLAKAFPGIEENTAEGMSVAVEKARALTKYGAAVVLIHHDTKAGGGTPRGSSVLHGDLDVELLLQVKEDGTVGGSLTKNRNGALDWFPKFKIGVHRIGQDIDGDPITAAYVARELAAQKSGDARMKRLTDSEGKRLLRSSPTWAAGRHMHSGVKRASILAPACRWQTSVTTGATCSAV